MLTLAQSLDLIEIGKAVGALGAPTILGIAVYVLWNELKAARKQGADDLAAAQKKLDEFQEARIREQQALIAALTGGKPA